MTTSIQDAMTRFWVSTYLIGQAHSLYRSIPASEDLSSNSAEALGSIVLSAAALEAAINEIGDWARDLSDTNSTGSGEDYAGLLGDFLATAEVSHVDLMSKYQFAYRIAADRAPDRSKAPFQDLSLLIQVRNFLLHMKGAEYSHESEGSIAITSVPLAAKLDSKKILALTPEPFANRISTRAAARWAGQATCAVVLALLDDARESEFKRRVSGFYRLSFGPAQFR